MLWEVELRPLGPDVERERVCDEFDLVTQSTRGGDLVKSSSRGFLLEAASLVRRDVERLAAELLVDPIVESCQIRELGAALAEPGYTVLLKPGVMDPVAESVLQAAADLGLRLDAVQTFRRYYGPETISSWDRDTLFRKVLANDAIERVVLGAVQAEHLTLGQPYQFQLITVPLRTLDEAALMQLSQRGQLALNLDEMRTIQTYFRDQGRDPTDVELETLAQTWSEHCSHKTLKGTIEYTETANGTSTTRRYQNMLKETVFAATQQIRRELGPDDWCVSVFSDNAGVVRFNDDYHVCFKVETHNRPSAIEPYGGANTGLGGVIRDVLGTGLGAKPIANTDVFCFAPPDFSPEQLPPGVLHPRRVMHGVVAGVRDYGNRMGIPTVNGAVLFDERYLANPLVFCGTVGLLPAGLEFKEVRDGDLIVCVGGRTGRDGIHGATFSSEGLTTDSESISGGAVQIGNAIAEKKVLDVILQARDRRLFRAITDCGAGGFSSAIGEMGAELGARVELELAPLKYRGLSYTEIWISESQERMVLAVPPECWADLQTLCAGEGVEAAALGVFEATGRLKLTYAGHSVADLEMHFLHEGRPVVVRQARFALPRPAATPPAAVDAKAALLGILSSLTVCSKEWIIRQYDHEVQGGSVIKPLVGVREDGPADAAVLTPVLGQTRGIAIGNGLNPRYADLDPWCAAACAIDEAVRNVVAVGADPARIAILDNFCWGNVSDPDMLGALVRTAEACREVAIAYRTPFISGKDSLNNSFAGKDGRRITIPHTLLVSALGQVPDIRHCLTMDLKAPGNDLYLLGTTRAELGGSHLFMHTQQSHGIPPRPDLTRAPRIFSALHQAIRMGLLRSCHDLSEGGLVVALAEMAFSGEVGADVTGLAEIVTEEPLDDLTLLFSESPSRFVLEAAPEQAAALRQVFTALPLTRLGTTTQEPRLRIAGQNGEWLIWARLSELKEAWQKPLRW